MSKAFQRIQESQSFQNKNNWPCIRTIDMHTGGEPLRVIISGLPEIKGNTILECRRYMKENLDHYRKLLMFEPRGHADMYGCVLLPPENKDSDFGILFLHNEGYSTMCGHAVIAITKLAVEMNWVEKVQPITKVQIDAPCGRIECFAKVPGEKVESVYFHGVPSFVVGLDLPLQPESLGKIKYDLAYGGAFYAYVDADECNLKLVPGNYSELIRLGMEIKQEVIKTNKEIVHPLEPDLSFLYGTIFTSKNSRVADSRNVCIFANGEVDRSPTGSGVSGRMAIHYQRGDLKLGEEMTIESLVGSIFKATPLELTKYGKYEAVIPKVEGTAYITGENTFYLDPEDEYKEGLFLR